MVRVTNGTSDRVTAWRIRDALAMHPLLGGATAQIQVSTTYDRIVLEGWTLDEELTQLAIRLALRAAGRRSIQPKLRHTQRCIPS